MIKTESFNIKNSLIKFHANYIWLFYFVIVLTNYVAIFIYSENFWGVWKIGEYLVNYDHGIIRRGLIGNLFIPIGRFFDLPALYISYYVFIFSNIIMFFIFYIVRKLYLLNTVNIGSFMLLYSPLYILFPFYCFQVAYRKEILIYLSFSILAYAFAFGVKKINQFKPNKYIWISFFIFFISLFSHETTIFTLPFFLFLIYKIKKKNLITYNKAKLYYALFFTATLLALLLSFYLSTDLERNLLISNQLCSDLLEYGFAKQMCIPLSSGIAKNTIDYINLTSSFYIFLLKNYFLLFFIFLVPIFISNWIKVFENKLLMIIGFMALIPLFILATDWGRWFNIYVFLIFTLILSEGVNIEFKIKKINVFFVFIYLSCLSMANSHGDPEHSIKEVLIYNLKNSLILYPINLYNDYNKYKEIEEFKVPIDLLWIYKKT